MSATRYAIRTRKRMAKRQILADVIQRIVEAAKPNKVILFGLAQGPGLRR